MFFEIELLILILMIGSYIALRKFCKLSSGICLIITSIFGMLLGTIFNQTDFSLRFIIEGSFAYFDTILTILVAMVCISVMKATGVLDYFTTKIVRLFRKTPILLAIALAFLVMLPAMITGIALSSIVIGSAIVLPILIKWGLPKNKAAAFIVVESIMGQICPPVNIPAMVICDVTGYSYVGFVLPLLALTIPCAIFGAIILTKGYVTKIDEGKLAFIADLNIEKELKPTCLIPFGFIGLFLILERIWPKYLVIFNLTLVFAVACVLTLIFGKKTKFFTNFDDKETIVGSMLDGVKKSLPVVGILMGIGCIMTIFTLVGVRGYIAFNLTMLPRKVQYITSIIFMPLLGGISSIGTATIIGSSFSSCFLHEFNFAVMTSGLSLLSSVGEFLPPFSPLSDYMAEEVEEKGWTSVTKAGLPAIIGLAACGLLYSFLIGSIADGKILAFLSGLGDFLYVIVMVVLAGLLAGGLAIYYLIKNKMNRTKEAE